MIATIAKFEFNSLWKSNIGWVCYLGVSIAMGYLFLGYIDQFIEQWQNKYTVSSAIIAQLFGDGLVLSLLILPIVSAKSLAYDSPYSPISLLICSPINMSSIVIGKYMGLLSFSLPILAIACLMSYSLYPGTEFDHLRVLANCIGTLGVFSVLIATSLFFSVLLNNSLAAALVTYAIVILLWILDSTLPHDSAGTGIIGYIALMPHFEAPSRGVIALKDVGYFVISTATLLAGCIAILAHRHTNSTLKP